MVAWPWTDALPRESGGMLSIRGEPGTGFYRLKTGDWAQLTKDESATVHWGRFAVVYEGLDEHHVAWILDIETKARQRLPSGRFYNGAFLETALPIVCVDGVVMDLSSGKALGCASQTVYAVRLDGSVLVARQPSKDDAFADVGPLEWQRPKPIAECARDPRRRR
jgi:hypothetical protein